MPGSTSIETDTAPRASMPARMASVLPYDEGSPHARKAPVSSSSSRRAAAARRDPPVGSASRAQRCGGPPGGALPSASTPRGRSPQRSRRRWWPIPVGHLREVRNGRVTHAHARLRTCDTGRESHPDPRLPLRSSTDSPREQRSTIRTDNSPHCGRAPSLDGAPGGPLT